MDATANTSKPANQPDPGSGRAQPGADRLQPGIVRVDPRPAPGAPLADLGPLLNKRQVAERISRSVSWLNAAFARGDFPRPIYLGRSVAWPQLWVDQWIAAQVQAQLDPQPAAA